MKNIAIIGAGSHTRSSLNIIKQNFTNQKIQIFDDSFNPHEDEFITDIKLCGRVEDIENDASVFLSIGDNKKRALYFKTFQNQIIKENLFHNTAIKEENIQVGISNQIFAQAYINSLVKIGDNNILNTASILEHEVVIGSHNHISVGAKLCGRVRIGNNCTIGAGAIIIDKISICDNVIIGAGAVVVDNITESGTYVGVPARKIK